MKTRLDNRNEKAKFWTERRTFIDFCDGKFDKSQAVRKPWELLLDRSLLASVESADSSAHPMDR
jgi:hypothetical protein